MPKTGFHIRHILPFQSRKIINNAPDDSIMELGRYFMKKVK